MKVETFMRVSGTMSLPIRIVARCSPPLVKTYSVRVIEIEKFKNQSSSLVCKTDKGYTIEIQIQRIKEIREVV